MVSADVTAVAATSKVATKADAELEKALGTGLETVVLANFTAVWEVRLA